MTRAVAHRHRRPRKSFGDHLLLHGIDLDIAERTLRA
jgi:hypothetical protein